MMIPVPFEFALKFSYPLNTASEENIEVNSCTCSFTHTQRRYGLPLPHPAIRINISPFQRYNRSTGCLGYCDEIKECKEWGVESLNRCISLDKKNNLAIYLGLLYLIVHFMTMLR